MSKIVQSTLGILLGIAGWSGGLWAADADSTAAKAPEAKPRIETRQAATPASSSGDEEGLLPRVSMDFQNANLKDILKSFSQQTGINIIATGEVSDQPLTLYFEDVTVMDALDQILRAGNLTYERTPGSDIYIVKPKSDQYGRTITRVYRLRYSRVSKTILAKAATVFGGRTPFEASIAGVTGSSSTTGGGTTSASLGGAGIGGGTGQGGDVGIDAVIKELLTDQGKLVVDSRTNSLIVTDVPENFARIEAALAALDVRTPQIMVDAELIETTLQKLKDLGIKWGGQDGNVLSFTPGARRTRFPFGSFGESIAPSTATSGGGPVDTAAVAAGTDPRFSLSTLSASSFQGILQALETDTDTKILARPKVLTLDNESALIRLTSDEAVGFTSNVVPQGSGTTTTTPERVTTGVVLVVTPQVNDNGYITMLVEPSVTKTVTSNLTAPVGQSQPRDPKTRSSRTLVRVRNGDTLVVGGLIDRSEQVTDRSVPILSGIPFLGEAFKHKEINNSASELIVFMTPRILDEPNAAQMAATGQGPMGLREQESSGTKQEAVEHMMNQLERQAH